MRYLVNGTEIEVEPDVSVQILDIKDRKVVRTKDGSATALIVRVGDVIHVSYHGQIFRVEKPSSGRSGTKQSGTGDTRAPMPGLIVEVFVEQGHQVILGQKLLVLEAMKMQHTVVAPFDGVVSALPVHKGDQISEGQLLVHVEAIHE